MTKKSSGPTTNHVQRENLLLVNSLLTTRLSLLRRQMTTLDATKDIDKECGYPSEISPEQYQAMYDREGIAKRVVGVFPEESWKHDPEVCDSEDTETDTEFEKSWKGLVKRFNLFNLLLRADRLSGIGSFGLVLIGIDDGKSLDQPIGGVQEDGTFKPPTTPYKLLYLKSFSQAAVQIGSFEQAVSNPRFGLPTSYNINFARVDTGDQATATQQPMPTNQTAVHWTRVIHLADNRDSSDVFGVPRMRVVYNRLYDLRKLLSSSAEMFWKGAFQGLSLEVDPTISGSVELDKKAIGEEMDEYQNGLRRYIALQGMTAKSLAPAVADPTNHFIVHMKAIAASIGVPWRVFLGTEEAQLAGEQDGTVWIERIKDRQVKYISPMIITPFVDRLQGLGILPPCQNNDAAQADSSEIEKPSAGLIINWPELHNPSLMDKASIAKMLAEAMSTYINSGGDSLMQPLDFLVMIMGFTQKQAEAIMDAATEYAVDNAGDPEPQVDDEGNPIHDETQFETGPAGSRFKKIEKTRTPKPPPTDPKDVALQRKQAAADIERTKAEALAKRKSAGKKRAA